MPKSPHPSTQDRSDSSGTSVRTVDVKLGKRSYSIHIGAGLLARAHDFLAGNFARSKTAIITDKNVAGLYLDTLIKDFEAHGFECSAIVLDPGEASKSLSTLGTTLDQLLRAGIERNDIIIALGGGVIGDLAGFSAAILRRGVPFIQIPTTLLAQVDSAIGGKTGINSDLGKNLIGAFHQPVAVLTDISLLKTLPKREFAAGYAEVMKYGLIGDADFFAWLEDNREKLFNGDDTALIHAVETGCAMKARIVAEDEHETGVRALLNLGHTFGHALEAATQYSNRLLHGEGVAIGMNLAYRLSAELEFCPAQTAERVTRHILAAGLPAEISDIPGDPPGLDVLLDIMAQDKKFVSGAPMLILARDIGAAFTTRDIPLDRIKPFLAAQLAK